jgi:hypothetical protein
VRKKEEGVRIVEKSIWSFFSRRLSFASHSQDEGDHNSCEEEDVLLAPPACQAIQAKKEPVEEVGEPIPIAVCESVKKPARGATLDISQDRKMSMKVKTDEAVSLWSRTGVDLSQSSVDFADSTASFRLRCKEHSNTLPEINLDLSEEELDELAPKVRESWLRLQAILES